MLNRLLPPDNHASCLNLHLNNPLKPTLLMRDTISSRAQFSGRQSPGQNLPRAPISCQAVSAPDIPLDRMQLEKLQAALAHGRKRISVKQLCKEVQLDRADVLQWLKHFESTEPGMRASVLGAKKAAIEAKEERQSILSGSRPGDRPARQKEPRERLHYKPGFEPHTPGSAPWAANYGRKKLPRSAEATLERIFDESPHPSEAVVKGLFDLHRLPRRRVLDWFAQRRRERSVRSDDRITSGQAHGSEQQE